MLTPEKVPLSPDRSLEVLSGLSQNKLGSWNPHNPDQRSSWSFGKDRSQNSAWQGAEGSSPPEDSEGPRLPVQGQHGGPYRPLLGKLPPSFFSSAQTLLWASDKGSPPGGADVTIHRNRGISQCWGRSEAQGADLGLGSQAVSQASVLTCPAHELFSGTVALGDLAST